MNYLYINLYNILSGALMAMAEETAMACKTACGIRRVVNESARGT